VAMVVVSARGVAAAIRYETITGFTIPFFEMAKLANKFKTPASILKYLELFLNFV
jgi:hypothetical protein